MAFLSKYLLLMFLVFSWPGLENPSVLAVRIREHYIAAHVASWNYSSLPKDPARLSDSEPLFKKIIYTEYEADFKKEKPRSDLSGLMGPTLRAEVGDTLIIHFKNLADKSLSIHPQSTAYHKQSEGSSYFDRTSPKERVDDGVPPGQMYKYIWEVTAKTGPREADPPCLTYTYYSHVNMVQDFNSGLIGALLICKEGSLNEDGTQKQFDKEYVLIFAVFDESKSWHRTTSLMYTINGYANGTLPEVQACAYDRISWHLIGMSSGPEIFSIHFNGQTLEQNQYKVSTVNLVGGASATANMSVSKTGRWLISSLVAKHLQAGMHGYLNIEDCGNPDTLTKKLSFKELRMIKDWDYFIAAEEIVWDYAPEIPDNIDRKYKAQYLENFSNLIGKKYIKAVFTQYKDATFSKRTDNVWFKERGILGPVIRAQVRDKIKIVFKNMASRPYSIYVHGVTLSKEAEGAIYPSDSKENVTQGKAVQPGETYTYKWTVLDTDEPTAKDAQCVTRLYHSAVDMTRDIASGLIGPLLICKRKALDQKGIQNKADVEQHAVFAVFDENKSWYLEDNIKEHCSNPSTVKRDDPKFYKSNVMHTLNGYAADRKHILGFCQSETVGWHLISVGTQDEIVPVHLSGHSFLSRGRDQDILNLFPMSGESATVTMDNVGTWLLSSWGSREMNSGMRLRFRDAKCDNDDDDYVSETENYFGEEDDVDANVVSFPLEKTKQEKEKENRGAVVDEDEDEEQLKLAEMLGLRTFKGTVAEKEDLNLTALAMQEDEDNMTSMNGGGHHGRSGEDANADYDYDDDDNEEDDTDNIDDHDDVSGNSHLVFTDSSDHLHGDELQETQSTTSYSTSLESFHPTDASLARIPFSDIRVERSTLPFEQGRHSHEKNAIQVPGSYSQTTEPGHLRTIEEVQRKDGAKLLVSPNTPFSEKEEEENVSGRDTSGGKRTKPTLTEATLFALKEMQALLFHVKQKRNLSSLDNTTSDVAFLTTPTTVNMSSSYMLETDHLSHDYDETAEDANIEPLVVLTNLTLAVEESVENSTSKPQHASSELKFLKEKRNISTLNLTTLDSPFIAIPATTNASSLGKTETDNFSHDYDEDEEEEANTESPILPTDLNLAVGKSEEITVSGPHHVSSEPKFSEVQNSGNLTLDNMLGHLVATPIPKTVKSLKDSLHYQGQMYPPKKMENTWNVISEKQSYDAQAALAKDVDNELQNSSRNATEYPEKMTFINKKNKEAHKANSLLEFSQAETGNKHEVLNEERSENFTVNTSGTFIKIRRKKKNASILTPRTSKPLGTHGGLNNSQASITANYTSLLNETSYTRTQKQSKPIVTIGLPVENGDYQEYIIDSTDDEESSSGSFEYQMVHYDNPYTTDSRLDSSTARNPDDIAGRYLRALNKGGNLRRYYIAAEEVFWDYAARQKSTVRSGQTKTVYRKVIFRSYQDDTFRIPSTGGEYEEHLGILGPVIRAEVDDVIQVQFKNMATRSYSLHAHGLYYEKSSEGRSYDDHSPEWFKTDDAIRPNETYTYVWHANKRSGPAEDQRVCKSWAYYSAVNPEKDIHSGLIGPILICQKGMLDEYNRPKDMREFVLSFMVFDEEKSWYFDKYGKRTQAERPSGAKQRHVFPGINGISYQLQGLRMYMGEEVHWHLLNMGGPKDIHVIHFHGQTFMEQGMEDHQLGVYPLLPGTFTTVEMTPSRAGKWLLETEVGEYQEAGMQALFSIIDKECKLPMGLESGIIQDSQISASGHTGYWEPKLARLNNAGKYNAWSIEKKKNEHPWIQVNLQKQVIITGIQTQGAMQLLKHMYTTEYFITYSKDGRKWTAFKGDHRGTQKLFEGNSDAHGIKENRLDPPIVASYVRIYPNKFYNRPTLRMELFGCETEDCSMALGMENGAIENAQITASSYKKTWWSSWEPSLARLNLKGRTNAWQAKSNNNQQWLQIDLLQPKKITGIITQGARSMTTEMYVKTFSILYSNDDSTWNSYVDDSTSTAKVFTGNINSVGQVKHYFEPPIFSRFIRVVPKTWNQSIALRIELFGCDDF
ncbi:coagulation factor V [Sceloporus undulatus]|uniref:coagulation factor V n=1 Tax=Sceloporus undulatus TaxID=8520 RepID=UPI001C4BFF60|nr:coagulation factor V [Sceloporus undulatus]